MHDFISEREPKKERHPPVSVLYLSEDDVLDVCGLPHSSFSDDADSWCRSLRADARISDRGHGKVAPVLGKHVFLLLCPKKAPLREMAENLVSAKLMADCIEMKPAMNIANVRER